MDLAKSDNSTFIVEGKDVRQISNFPMSFYTKRCCDFLISFLLLLLLAPFLLLTMIAIKVDSPGPIFHHHERVGLRGKHFRMWKFRTMVSNALELQSDLESRNNANGGVLFKLVDDPRVTRVGKFLRRYSIDELPQIINVLQGEMSLVGPRPLVLRDVERMPQDMLFRHDVLPGITGLWQVKGRSSLSDDKLFYWDKIYIQRWSLALDFQILLQTLIVILQGNGSY